jgi:hypothetical protein
VLGFFMAISTFVVTNYLMRAFGDPDAEGAARPG